MLQAYSTNKYEKFKGVRGGKEFATRAAAGVSQGEDLNGVIPTYLYNFWHEY
jgi:hypothetical protein